MYGIRIEKPEWEGFLALLSRTPESQRALIAVNSPKLGSRPEAEWLPLLGMTYDGHDDVIDIALEQLDHQIRRPRELYFAEEAGWFTGVAIVDSEGARHFVMLREAPLLRYGEA